MLGKLTKLVAILSDPTFLTALIRHGVAAGAEHARVLRSLNCRTVVDLGANRGQFALVARRYFPSARIVSFEPLAKPAQHFRSCFAGDPNVSLHQSALGPMAGEATMHVSAKDDSSSLLPITVTQSELFPGTAEMRTQTVRVGRLQDFVKAEDITPPALLKLDVQGYELEALKGCEELLGYFAHVYVECSFVELYQGQALANAVLVWLQERKFGLAGVYNLCYDQQGRAVQGDFLFRSEDAV